MEGQECLLPRLCPLLPAFSHSRGEAQVLVLGCSTGEILAGLKPSYGVGVDISSRMIDVARQRYPAYEFIEADAEEPSSWRIEGTFDFIVMPSLIGYLEDIQATFENLHPFCHPGTRVIIGYYNFLWEPVLKLGEKLHLKMPQKMQNWLSLEDIENLLYLADFETVKKERRLLVPKKIPLLYKAFECIGSLPCLNKLCLCNKEDPFLTVTDFTGFSVIQAKNASGNLAKDTLRIMESLIAILPSDSSTVELHLAAAILAGVLGLQNYQDHLAKAQLLAPNKAQPRVRAVCEQIRSTQKQDKFRH